MLHTIRAFTLACALAAPLASPVLAQEAKSAPSPGSVLNLSASGEAKVTPDMATISLGVDSAGLSAAGTMRDNGARVEKLIEAVKQSGVPAKDIHTQRLALTPQGGLRGYKATTRISITLYDLEQLGPAIDALAGSGAPEITNVNFGLRDPRAAEDAARLDAARQLQAKADLYARAFGRHIGRLRGLREGMGTVPDSGMWDFTTVMGANAGDGRGNVAAYSGYRSATPNDIVLTATLSASYELEP